MKEIKIEIFKHPILGDLTKQVIYTYDENGIEITRELYVPPVLIDASLIDFSTLTAEQTKELKKSLATK